MIYKLVQFLWGQASKKRRLDEVCAERFPQYSRNVVQSWIAQGKVSVNDKVVLKAGTPVAPDASIAISAEVPKFVCRYCPLLCIHEIEDVSNSSSSF